MPVYDRTCSECGDLREDLLEPIGKFQPLVCSHCGERTLVRTIATGKFHKSTGITPDLIPGGINIKHGICWPDGTPRRYDSKSEMKRVAQELGVENMVRHVGLPGTDKSPATSRWVSAPTISEEERISHLKSLYAAEGVDLDRLPAPVDSAPNSILSESARDRHIEAIIAKQVHDHLGV